MSGKINFPLIYADKVYYNIDEVPEELRSVLENLSETENKNKNLAEHWEINGIVYTNFDDIPAEYQKYFEDRNKNGIQDFVEDKIDISKSSLNENDTKKMGIKNICVNDLSSPHKTTYIKKTQRKKDYNPLIIMLFLLAIIALVVFIVIKN